MKTPISGRITSPFGERIHPITKEKQQHNGVDISAPIGTPIIAPESGRIKQIYNHAIGGNTLMMVSDRGTRYGFCHLSKIAEGIVEGSIVAEGDVICYTGNTGRSTGPHLHFSVQKNNVWIDPETMFKF